MEINPDIISEYCAHHSTRPSSLCDELEAFTKENVAMSVMLSGPVVGSFLGFMVSLLKAKTVIEIGTYTGYSALCMAERLPSDGRLISVDINEETVRIAKRFWARSKFGSQIESQIGDATRLIPLINGPVDFVFIDADKAGYRTYLDLVSQKLSDHGVIVADNALYSGEVLNPGMASPGGKALADFNDYVINHSLFESVLLPVRDGLQVIKRRT